MSKFPTSTWGQETDANRIKKTYVKGYMDVSGGELSVHNTAFNILNSDGSGVFRMDPRKITVNDDTGQEVDISLSYLTFLNSLVPPDGQAVSIPDKVKYIFTSGTETRIGKPDASSNFRVFGNTYVEQNLFVKGDISLNNDMDISGSLTVRTHLKLPVGGNDQRPVTINEAESAGYIRYNIDNSQFEGYGPGDSWGSLGGVINVSQNTKIIASSPDPDSVNNELQFFTAPTGSTLVGDTKERMRILANGDISMNARLLVASDASLNGNLFVAAKTRLGNDLSLNGNIFVYGGDASFNGRLLLSGDASLNGNLFVSAKTRLGNDLSLNGNIFIYGGDASLNGRLFVRSDASLNGNLFVSAKTRLGNDLSLNGNFTMYGDASLNGRLMLSGDASLNGNLYVAAKTRLGNDLSLNGNFTMYGDASLNGRLMLSGDASLNGNLYVAAKTRLGNDLSLNGNIFIYGGDASLNGRLFVANDTSLNGNLFVRGRTTFYEPSGSVISSGTSRGTLNLTHGDASGGSSILFQSVNSPDNDYAYIQYQENVPYAGQTTTEAGLLTIGIENEITSTHRDRISLWAANGSGNVGVNTKFPNYNLDVSGTVNVTGASGTLLRLQNTSGYNQSGNTHIDFFNSHSTTEASKQTGRISSMDLTTGTWVTALSFRTRYDADLVEGMRITGATATTATTYFNGNVGIGTTSPAYRLSLGTTNGNCKLAVYDDGTGGNWYGIGAISSNLTFGAGLAQSGTPQMVLSNGGNLGIGTTNPTYKLDVSGNCEVTSGTSDTNPSVTIIKDTGLAADFAGVWQHRAQLQIQDIAGNSMVLAMSTDGVGIIQGKKSGDGTYRHISINPASTNGNVGIGKINPQTKLDVTGTVQATSFNATSDYRVKANVMALDASFNVDVLKPVTYNNTRHGRKDVGFIAHEVQEHYPFLVNGEKDGEHMQSLNYIGLIGILTKEIQDLKRRLAEHEANLFSVENSVLAVGNSVLAVENSVLAVKNNVRSVEDNVRSVEDNVRSVEDNVRSVEDNVRSVETTVRSVDNHVRLVEDDVRSVETTVIMEQARLAICETGVALNKSAIKDIEDRFQS